jgi:vacuolar-type H+-ATPase subunit H
VQGLELIESLAKLDQDLAAKVEEAHRVADQRIKSAEEESHRLLAEAETQVQQMEEDSKIRIAKARSEIDAESQALAAEEKERLRNQALPNIDQAVAFILKEVIP